MTKPLPWYTTGTRVAVRHYGTRSGVIVRETPTRVWIEIVMTGRQARSVVRPYRKAEQQISKGACVALGTWAVADVEIEARYLASRGVGA